MSPNARRSMEIVLCSDCFQDPGLRMAAQGFGVAVKGACPVCRSDKGTKLDKERVAALARSFFVWGTMLRCDYGAAPVVQFNELQKTSIGAPPWLGPDLRRIEMATGFGFFHYRPRLWMVGGVGPLERCRILNAESRSSAASHRRIPGRDAGVGRSASKRFSEELNMGPRYCR